MNKYGKRLVEEWNRHGKLIIACDFDDTIKPWNTATQDECNRTIATLHRAAKLGIYLIIFTCRDTTNDVVKKEIESYCALNGLKIDAINSNAIPLPYGSSSKPYANVYIDDRGGRDAVLDMLEDVMGEVELHRINSISELQGLNEFFDVVISMDFAEDKMLHDHPTSSWDPKDNDDDVPLDWEG